MIEDTTTFVISFVHTSNSLTHCGDKDASLRKYVSLCFGDLNNTSKFQFVALQQKFWITAHTPNVLLWSKGPLNLELH
jgi:hypothetical protein